MTSIVEYNYGPQELIAEKYEFDNSDEDGYGKSIHIATIHGWDREEIDFSISTAPITEIIEPEINCQATHGINEPYDMTFEQAFGFIHEYLQEELETLNSAELEASEEND